jgi:hypothetical protein
MDQHSGPGDVTQKIMPQSGTVCRPFNQTRDVRQDQPAIASEGGHTKVRT